MPTVTQLNAVDYGFTPSAANPTAALQSAIAAALTQGKPLYIEPGAYTVGNIAVGGPLHLLADPGKVTLRLPVGAPFIFYFGSFGTAKLEGLIFDGVNRAFGTDPNVTAGYRALVVAKRDSANPSMLVVADCEFLRSTLNGLTVLGVRSEVTRTRFETCYRGALAVESDGFFFTKNRVSSCKSNGIEAYSDTGDTTPPVRYETVIAENVISSITVTDLDSTGYQGNGINLYKLTGATVRDNFISTCAFSAIRANGCSDVVVSGNHCLASGENAIFFESFRSDGGLETRPFAASIAHNVIDGAGNGVSVGNFPDHGGRLTSIVGNVVRNVTQKVINQGRASQYVTSGTAIGCEADAVVSGNVVETARWGLSLGTNDSTRDITATGNVVRSTVVGIGVGASTGARPVIVANNMIAGHTAGAVRVARYLGTQTSIGQPNAGLVVNTAVPELVSFTENIYQNVYVEGNVARATAA